MRNIISCFCCVFILGGLSLPSSLSAEEPPLAFHEMLRKYAFGENGQRPANGDLLQVAETQKNHGFHKDALRTILLVELEPAKKDRDYQPPDPWMHLSPMERKNETMYRDFLLGELVGPLLETRESGEATRAAAAIDNERYRARQLTRIVEAQLYGASYQGEAEFDKLLDKARKTLELIPPDYRDKAQAALAGQVLWKDIDKGLDLAEQVQWPVRRAELLLRFCQSGALRRTPLSREQADRFYRLVDAVETPLEKVRIGDFIVSLREQGKDAASDESEFNRTLLRETTGILLAEKSLIRNHPRQFFAQAIRCHDAGLTEETEKLLAVLREQAKDGDTVEQRIGALEDLKSFAAKTSTLTDEERETFDKRFFEEAARMTDLRQQAEQWYRLAFGSAFSDENKAAALERFFRTLEDLPKKLRIDFLLRYARRKDTEKSQRKERIDQAVRLMIETDDASQFRQVVDILWNNDLREEAVAWARSEKWPNYLQSDVAVNLCGKILPHASRSGPPTEEQIEDARIALALIPRIKNPHDKSGFYVRLDRFAGASLEIDWNDMAGVIFSMKDSRRTPEYLNRMLDFAEKEKGEIDWPSHREAVLESVRAIREPSFRPDYLLRLFRSHRPDEGRAIFEPETLLSLVRMYFDATEDHAATERLAALKRIPAGMLPAADRSEGTMKVREEIVTMTLETVREIPRPDQRVAGYLALYHRALGFGLNDRASAAVDEALEYIDSLEERFRSRGVIQSQASQLRQLKGQHSQRAGDEGGTPP